MNKFSVIPEEIRFKKIKSFSENRKNSTINYLLRFVEIFEDKRMESIHSSIIKTQFISEASILLIEKRLNSIPPSEIAHPLTYIEKYFDLIMELQASMVFSNEKIDEKRSLLDFYQINRYLTPKQKNFTHILFERAIPPNIKAKIKESSSIEDSIFFSLKNEIEEWKIVEALSIILKSLTQEGKETALAEIRALMAKTLLINSDKLKFFESKIASSLVKKEIKESQQREQQEPKKSPPKAFLSLNEMRTALGFIQIK